MSTCLNRTGKCLAVLGMALMFALSAACATTTEPVMEDSAEKPETEAAAAAETSRLGAVRARGRLICASLNDTPGFGLCGRGR